MFMDNLLKNVFGKVEPGLCRLTIDGKIAIKTNDGYKNYNINTKRLVNCEQFVFDISDDLFFVLLTSNLEIGDIIIINRKPKCIIDISDKDAIKAVNYSDGTIETLSPESHVFMGETCIYGKIISLFQPLQNGNMTNNIMSYMMMSKLMGNNETNLEKLIPLMMLNGITNNSMPNVFGNLFDNLLNCFNITKNNINNNEDKNEENNLQK